MKWVLISHFSERDNHELRSQSVSQILRIVFNSIARTGDQYSFPLVSEIHKCWCVEEEKASLAQVYQCKKFPIFIYGRPVLDEIDHKLLIAVAKKGLTNTPTEKRECFFFCYKYRICKLKANLERFAAVGSPSRAFQQNKTAEQSPELN